MPENKKTKVNTSAILPKELYDEIKEEALKNRRSVSSQIAFMLEEDLKRRKRA